MTDTGPDQPARAEWTDLLDPTPEQLAAVLPADLHWAVKENLEELGRPPDERGRKSHLDEPRPGLRAENGYVVGVFVVPVCLEENDRVFYQQVRIIIEPGKVTTVRTTPRDDAGNADEPFDVTELTSRIGDCHIGSAGMITYHVLDEIAERYLDLADSLHNELDEVEEHVDDWPSDRVRQRISELRHDMLHIRRTLSPTRDALHSIIDNRLELGHDELFPRDVEYLVVDAYNKLLRGSEGLDIARDLLGGVRDYHQAKIANDQNEVMKRLTAIASLLLVPTFIVGVYGQNFAHMPELDWLAGYGMSWTLIVVSTIAQLVYFRRKGWI